MKKPKKPLFWRARLTRRSENSEEVTPFERRTASMLSAWKSGWAAVFRTPKTPDIIAGFTVAAVAMPLNLALAVASGLPPAAGLFAGAIGGVIAATLGGTTYQVTGPAAALSLM